MELLRGVFTDAYCYLPWIAGEYGMKLPESYSPKDSCGQEIGLRENIEQAVCYGQDAENLNRERCLGCIGNPDTYYKCQKGLDEQGEAPVDIRAECCTSDLLFPEVSDWRTSDLSGGSCPTTGETTPAQLPGSGRTARCDFDTFTVTGYRKDGETRAWDQCLLESQEGYVYNVYKCKVYTMIK